MRRKQKTFRAHDPTPSHGAGGRRERSLRSAASVRCPLSGRRPYIPKKIWVAQTVLEGLKKKEERRRVETVGKLGERAECDQRRLLATQRTDL